MTVHRKLLLAMHRGHEPSAQRLWGLFAHRLRAYAAAALPKDQQHAADDVVQQVFCNVLTQPRRELKKIDDVAAWLFKATRNAALNHTRTEHREHTRRPAATAAAAHASPPHTPASHTPGSDELETLRAATDALPNDQREIILLRHVGGLTLDQAALALGANRNTLASRYNAGVDTLRRSLDHADFATPAPNHSPRQPNPTAAKEIKHA